MAKISETTPSNIALCVKLAGNHARGVLLFRIHHWIRYATIELPNSEGVWIANPRSFWEQEAQLSPSQCDRALAALEQIGLIERRQYWFGRKNVLHVRPTEMTSNFMAAAKTWQAAEEFYPGAIESSKSDDPSPSKSSNSDQIINSGQLGITKMQNSNNMGTLLPNKHTVLQSAQPAAPACSKTHSSLEKSTSGKEKAVGPKALGSKNAKITSGLASYNAAPPLKELAAIWSAAVNHYCPVSKALDSKELGNLAEIVSGLGHMFGPKGEEDLRGRTKDILIYTVQHWTQMGWAKHPPNLAWLHHNLGNAVANWASAGRPVLELPKASPK